MINDDQWWLMMMGGNYHQPSFPLNWHFLYLFMSLPALPYLAMISWCPNIQGSAQETVGIINVEALIRHLGAHSVGSLALSCRVWTGWSRTFSATLIFFARRRKSHWNCRPFSHSKPRKYRSFNCQPWSNFISIAMNHSRPCGEYHWRLPKSTNDDIVGALGIPDKGNYHTYIYICIYLYAHIIGIPRIWKPPATS